MVSTPSAAGSTGGSECEVARDYVVDEGVCPWYAVLEADGGGYVIAQCDRPDGHDDSHHNPDVFPDFIDWEHPRGEGDE